MTRISNGVVHNVPKDLREGLSKDPAVLALWEALTPLARNEWICWITFAKKIDTRTEHIKRTIEDLKKGKKRPCCWIGCTHRTDKEVSPSIKYILNKQGRKFK
mgnify:FL=1|jgi:hypothetical protein